MSKWYIKNKKNIIPFDYSYFGLSEIEYKILVNRGIDTKNKIKEFLNPSYEYLNSPILLQGMIKSGNIMREALKEDWKVRIVGDYDVDGVMSTTILVKALKTLTYDVDYVIPHRVKDGYGLNKRIVEEASLDGVNLLITCDNGISAHEAIDFANELGILVIITDHHEIPTKNLEGKEVEYIPNAASIINPHLKSCNYPFKKLSGGAIAFKFVQHLFTIMGQMDIFDSDFLGFAAISTICDVMILQEENRSIITLGIEQLNRSNNIALNALKKECNINGELKSYHIGFIIGPTINSAGRLDTAEKAVELFITDDINKAENISKELRELNYKRQSLTNEGVKRIEEQLKNSNDVNQNLYLLYDNELHESIAGIIAGRIKNKYYRPTIIMTKGTDGIKGSGRSIDSFNITEEIRKHKEFLKAFGGHPMACGLSMDAEKFQPFKKKLLENLSLNNQDLEPIIRIDSPLKLKDVSIDFINKINSFAPFGNGNEEPLFGAKNLLPISIDLLGKNKNVLSIQLKEDNNETIYKAIMFQDAQDVYEMLNCKKNFLIDIVYIPKINEYNSRLNIQFEIKDFRISTKW